MGLLDLIPGPLNARGAIPAPVTSVLGIGATPAPAVNQQLPSYRAQFTNKYNDPAIQQQLTQLPDSSRNALLQYDADRVARGAPPLTPAQTKGAIQTAATGQPATAPPERHPLNIIGNAISDIGNIVKAVPALPAAVIHELQSIPDIPSHISQAEQAGQNPLSAFLSAPGVRMIPGAYTAANLTNGIKGLKEELTHPVMSLLDVLPGASKAAELTGVGGKAVEDAAVLGSRGNPLRALATQTLDEAGELTPNRLGRATQSFRDNTRIGQFIDQVGGPRNRDVSRQLADLNNRLRGVGTGLLPPSNPAEQAARDTVLLGEKYKFDTAIAADTVRRMQMDDWNNATPEQLAYHDEYKAIVNNLGDYAVNQGDLGRIYNPVTGEAELVTAPQARTVRAARDQADLAARMADRRHRVLNGSDRDLPTIQQDLRDTLASNAKPAVKKLELRSIYHELDAQGHDTTSLHRVLNQWRGGAGTDFSGIDAHIGNWFQDAQANPPAARLPTQDIITRLRAYGRGGDLQANDLANAVRDGNTKRMLSTLRNIERRVKTLPGIDGDPNFASSVRSLQSRLRYANEKLGDFTDKNAGLAMQRAERAMDRALPARYQPLVEDRALKKIQDLYTPNGATPEQAQQISQAVLQRRWKALPGYEPGITEREIAKITSDIGQTWRDLQAQGMEPTFVHRVDPSQVHQALSPTATEVPNSITQLKGRVLNASPMTYDATVALSHQAHEWMRRQTSEQFITQIGHAYGVTEQDLRESLAPLAQRYADRHPGVSMEAAFKRVMGQSHAPLNITEAGYNWGSPSLKQLDAERLWIPKSIANNLHALHDPKTVLGGIFDPVTKTFRHAVVGLSIRTQVNNILGNSIMSMGEVGPAVLTHMREGLRYAKNPELMLNDARISDSMRLLAGSEKELFKDLDKSAYSGKVRDMADLMKGRTLGRVYQQIQDSKASGAVGNLVDKSYSLNGFFDDATKISTYLTAYKKFVKSGLSEEAAQSAAEALTRRTLPDWGAMTPLERSLMKSIFPFYGFAQHIMRYTFRYPMEHPFRAMVVSKLADAEVADHQALPNFLGSLFVGSPDSGGNQTAIVAGGLNPFQSVGNSLTLAGFLSQTNPVLNSIFESVGLTNGTAELYPTLRYNADTGRLEAVHGNPLMNFVGNVIPQAQIPLALLGANSDFNYQLSVDPASAYHTLLSNAGIPVAWKTVNPTVEMAKAEVNRQKSAASVLASAQKSGDWTNALSYPSLRQYYDQARALSADQVVKFQARPNEAKLLIQGVGDGRGTPAPSGSLIQNGGNTGGI
jgi:hypothetical protein